VIILVPLAVLAAALAIGPIGLVSYTPATRLGVHSMIAFWIAIPAALSVLAYQRNPVRANILLISALIFPMVVHIGSAVKNLLRMSAGTIDRVLIDSATDTLEMTMLAVILASACVCMIRKGSQTEQRLPNSIFLVLGIFLPLILYGVTCFFVLPCFAASVLIEISWVFSGIAIVGFLTIALLVPKLRNYDFPIDSGYLISSVLLFAISEFVLLFSLMDPTMYWVYAETLQMAGFLLLALALGVPHLRKEGYRRRSAYGMIISLILMAYFPFLVTIEIETLPLDSGFQSINLLAYSIIHVGAASLSIMMAILLYIYPKKKTSWNQYPLILVFGMWAGAAIFLVFSLIFPSLVPYGEPITPITVGSILTIGLLYLTVRWTNNPPLEREKSPTVLQLFLVLLGLIATIVLGEAINQVALSISPSLVASPLGSVLIISSNLFIMFAFAYIIFLLSEASKGRSPVELYVVFFLAMWILPNILRCYYNTWTPGWWVSEILLFIGLIAGPPLLTWLYVRTMHEVEDSHTRANMYADLLMHDVSNYNQMLMMSLELLGNHEMSEEQRTRVAVDGRQVISFSEQLISNVRLLSEADQLKKSELQSTSLVKTIVSALDLFTRRVGSGELVVEFQPEDSHAYVVANDLLLHIFLNILYSALECRIRGEKVAISIHEIEHSGEDFWQIDIKAPGRKIDEEDGYSSGTLGLLAAQIMTESLHGTFSVETFDRTDVCEGRLFSIRLRTASA